LHRIANQDEQQDATKLLSKQNYCPHDLNIVSRVMIVVIMRRVRGHSSTGTRLADAR